MTILSELTGFASGEYNTVREECLKLIIESVLFLKYFFLLLVQLSGKLGEDGTKNPSEKPSQQKSIAFSSNNSVAKPMLQKSAKATAEETSSGSPKIDKKKSPYGLWLPV